YKQAPLTLFQRVACHAMDLGLPVVMIGSSADNGRAEAFRQELDSLHQAGFVDLVGQLEWEETLGLLGSSAVLVSNDSGIMHVGLACGTKTVAFFGPTDPYALIPRANQHLYPVFLNLPCQPCWHKGPTGRFRCPDVKKACLQQIDPENVNRLVSTLVTGRQPNHLTISPTGRHP
ncbi:MAG: glycosyltransferase family 9 protein, partial [bacterium]